MSSFSSVVQKPGKKIVPKAVVRRNIQRKPAPSSITASVDTQSQVENNDQNNAQVANASEANDRESQPAQAEQEQERDNSGRSSQPSNVVETPILAPIRPPTPEAPYEESAEVSISTITAGPEPPSLALTENLPPARVSDSSAADEIGRRDTSVEDAVQVHAPAAAESQSAEEPSLTIDPEPSDHNNSGVRIRPRRKAAVLSTAVSTPRKRRKVTPETAPDVAPSQSIVVAPAVQPSPQDNTVPRRQSSQSQPPEDLLQSATRRAASVSRLANEIDPQTRSLQHQEERNTNQNETDLEIEGASASVPSSPQRGRKRRKKTLQEQAVEVVANATRKSRTSRAQRGPTPENAEEYELEPAKVKMGELCEDTRLGKKSALETEMEANWSDIVQRRKEDRERALANAEKRRRKGIGQKHQLNNSDEPVTALAPAMAVVNGVIVVDQASREIDRSAQLQQAAFQDLDNVREDKDYYKHVHQGTVGMKPGHGQHTKWDAEANERFFQGLRMFGTDFLMIANMFPGLTRKQIKSKFIREENADKARIQQCLRDRQPVQLEDYASMANKEIEEFRSLESIQKELDEQEKRLRDEDNERRKREGFVNSTDDNTQQSAAEGNQDGTEGQSVPTQPGRFDAMAAEIVEAAAAPKKRQRKTTTMNNKRGPRGGKRPEGGIEEILGNIHEVAV